MTTAVNQKQTSQRVKQQNLQRDPNPCPISTAKMVFGKYLEEEIKASIVEQTINSMQPEDSDVTFVKKKMMDIAASFMDNGVERHG